MSDPVRFCWSRDELRDAALSYMREVEGLPDKDNIQARATWYERLGLLECFAAAIWERRERPSENVTVDRSTPAVTVEHREER